MGRMANVFMSLGGKWYWEDYEGELYGPFETEKEAYESADDYLASQEAKGIEAAESLMEDQCECPRCSGHPEE